MHFTLDNLERNEPTESLSVHFQATFPSSKMPCSIVSELTRQSLIFIMDSDKHVWECRVKGHHSLVFSRTL